MVWGGGKLWIGEGDGVGGNDRMGMRGMDLRGKRLYRRIRTISRRSGFRCVFLCGVQNFRHFAIWLLMRKVSKSFVGEARTSRPAPSHVRSHGSTYSSRRRSPSSPRPSATRPRRLSSTAAAPAGESHGRHGRGLVAPLIERSVERQRRP